MEEVEREEPTKPVGWSSGLIERVDDSISTQSELQFVHFGELKSLSSKVKITSDLNLQE